jgi:hypothetical protein
LFTENNLHKLYIKKCMNTEKSKTLHGVEPPKCRLWSEIVVDNLVNPLASALDDLRRELEMTEEWDEGKKAMLREYIEFVDGLIYEPEEAKFYQSRDPSQGFTVANRLEVAYQSVKFYISDIRDRIIPS